MSIVVFTSEWPKRTWTSFKLAPASIGMFPNSYIEGVNLLINEVINLYVDDLRDCPKGYTIARNVEEAIYYIENYKVHILSLDHDLGVNKEGILLPTGYDLVKYICEKNLKVDKIYIHTDNGVGRENMFQTLKAAQRRGFIDKDIEIYHYSITTNKYSG